MMRRHKLYESWFGKFYGAIVILFFMVPAAWVVLSATLHQLIHGPREMNSFGISVQLLGLIAVLSAKWSARDAFHGKTWWYWSKKHMTENMKNLYRLGYLVFFFGIILSLVIVQ